MTQRTFWKFALLCSLVVTGALASVTRAQGDVNVMTTEALRAQLGKPGVVVVDVRTGSDWSASAFKIKGAVRVEARQITSLARRYDKDTTLVLYCA